MDKKAALRHINHAWIAGFAAAGLALIFTIFRGSASRAADAPEVWFGLLDVVVFAALSYGVKQRSRAAAVLLFATIVLTRAYYWASGEFPRGIFVALILGYFFFQGIRGTFAYHDLSRESPAPPPPPAPPAQLPPEPHD